jgi:hypothetical protein
MAMGVKQKPRKLFSLALGLFFLALVIVIGAVLAGFLGIGRGLGLRSLPRTAWNTIQAVLHSRQMTQSNQGDYTNIIFLHHSTGDHLVEQGGLHQLFSEAGYRFWDQGYNYRGLRDPQGNFTGYGYSVPRDNTDPDGLANIFKQPAHTLPLNTFSGLLQHEVIIIKSCCAPTSNVTSDEQLEQYKQYYFQIRESIDRHPDKLFILMTQPPLNPAGTNPQEAGRARQLANWLVSEDYLGGRRNLVAFDFFDYLAEGNSLASDYNMLRQSYRRGSDSHPNREANEEIAPQFVEFVIQSVQTYRENNLTPTP